MARALSMILLTCLISGCSDAAQPTVDAAQVPTDSGQLDGAVPADKGKTDTGKPADKGKADRAPDAMAAVAEKEPNDGKTKTDYQSVTSPVVIKGSIGKADDIDLFALSVKAGQRLKVTVGVFVLRQKERQAAPAGARPGAVAVVGHGLPVEPFLRRPEDLARHQRRRPRHQGRLPAQGLHALDLHLSRGGGEREARRHHAGLRAKNHEGVG
jgi:hypothetical protein